MCPREPHSDISSTLGSSLHPGGHQQRDCILRQQQKLTKPGWAALSHWEIRSSDHGKHPVYLQLPNVWLPALVAPH